MEVFLSAALAGALVCLLYVLYRSGWLVLNTKRALLYAEAPRLGRPRIQARFSGCTGTVRRVVRLRQPCRFVFSPALNKGCVHVEIRGWDRRMLAILTAEAPCAVVDPGPAGCCRLSAVFEQADGSYALTWQAAEDFQQTLSKC